MHVAILGAGALGRVYGVRLAQRAGCTVTFIVRPGRALGPVRIERIDGDGAREELPSPTCSPAVPGDADVVLVAVRVEQLDPALDAVLAATGDVPLVTLTPLLPHDLDALQAAHGARVRVAMPGVVSYVTREGVCRYWLPRVAPTLVDATPPIEDAVRELVSRLATAGFGGKLEAGVRDTNPATTIAFIPLAMGVDAGGGVDALLADRALLRTALAAVAEGLELAGRIGKTPGWVGLLTRFAGPTSLKVGIALAKARYPEALAYVEEHFGRKLHAQNVAMARGIVELAEAKGSRSEALRALLGRLEAVA